eukprot:5214264-Alexandrium_andersonii.AAC.1
MQCQPAETVIHVVHRCIEASGGTHAMPRAATRRHMVAFAPRASSHACLELACRGAVQSMDC